MEEGRCWLSYLKAGPDSRMVGAGYRLDGAGYRLDGGGYWLDGAGYRLDGADSRIAGAYCQLVGAGYRLAGAEGWLAEWIYWRGWRVEPAPAGSRAGCHCRSRGTDGSWPVEWLL